MRRDIYKHKERYLAWKEKVEKVGRIEKVTAENSTLILNYLNDMELGINVAGRNKKGARSHITLNNAKQRLCFISRLVEERMGIKSLADIEEEQIFRIFGEMRNGTIKRVDGTQYRSVGDYIRVFKAFWHWYQKSSRKAGVEIPDITTDLDAKVEKPRWVYLTEEQVKAMANKAKYQYRVLIWFLFDTGIRSPGELMNVKVSDLYNDYKELNIREEAVKKGSFGRRIKLMLCSDFLKEYVKYNDLESNDYLFDMSKTVINRYLKRLSKKLFGDTESPAGDKYSNLTMYDFRHNACCYWLPRYKSESALKYRFGWKKSDKIHYYSEMLGMKDTISEEDLLIDTTKTELEKRLAQSENANTVLQEQLQAMQEKLNQMSEDINARMEKAKARQEEYNAC